MRRGNHAWVGALGVVLLIAGTARSAVMMPVFGPASPVTELNAHPSNDVPTWASADGLKALLHSDRNGVEQLFSATRASIAQPFSAPVTSEFVNNNIGGHNVTHAVLSSNGLELFYADYVQSRTPQTLIMRATRANTAAAFSAGTPVAELMLGTTTYPSYLSADGLRLYIFKSLESDALVATRAAVGAPFGAPSPAPFVNTPNVDSPYLSADELQLFFGSNLRLWWTSRPSIAAAFDPPQVLSSVTGGNLGAPIFFNGDTLMFYDSSGTDGDIWQARIPEPAGVASLALGGAVGLSLRRRRA